MQRLGLSLLPLWLACSYHLHSPPARMVTLESARTAAPGETVVGARGARYGAIFDPGVAVANVGARHGVADGTEVDAEASYASVVDVGENVDVDIDRHIYTGRVGVKQRLYLPHTSVVAGLGGGHAPAAGSFLSADAGFLASYDNCYVVPFSATTAFASLPVMAKTVYLGEGHSSKATTTYGLGLSAGLEIPLQHARCRERKTPARLQIGASAQVLWDTEGKVTSSCGDGCTTSSGGDYVAFGLAAGFEIPF